MCVGSPTAGAWSSFQRRPDDEFETDKLRCRIRNGNAKRLLSETWIKDNSRLASTHHAEQCGQERRFPLSGDRDTMSWLLSMNCFGKPLRFQVQLPVCYPLFVVNESNLVSAEPRPVTNCLE